MLPNSDFPSFCQIVLVMHSFLLRQLEQLLTSQWLWWVNRSIHSFIYSTNMFQMPAVCQALLLFCSYNRENGCYILLGQDSLWKFPPSSMRLKGFSGFCWQGQRQSCCNSQWPLSSWPFKSKRCKHLIKACNDMKVNFIDLKIVFKKSTLEIYLKKIF